MAAENQYGTVPPQQPYGSYQDAQSLQGVEPPRSPLRWIIIGGCGCFSLVLLAIAGCVVLGYYGIKHVKSLPPYVAAVEAARQNQQVVDALGEPIEPGLLFQQATYNVDGTSAVLDIAFSVSGPEGNGTIFLKATMTDAVWTTDSAYIVIAQTGERIQLLPDDAEAPESGPPPPPKEPEGLEPAEPEGASTQ